MGTVLGEKDGTADGELVGTSVGLCEWKSAVPVGDSVGTEDGMMLGAAVGTKEGTDVGAALTAI